MICALVASVVIGNVIRLEVAPKFSKYANYPATPSSWIQLPPVPQPQASSNERAAVLNSQTPPVNASTSTLCPVVNLQNSIAIRKQLYSEAFSMTSKAGLFGIGMDRFMDTSCVKGTEIHNTILQATIEFGWIAGPALVALLIVAGLSLWPLARCDAEAQFALCGLIFVAVLSVASGRISRDFLLFLFLGYAAGLRRVECKIPKSAALIGAFF